MRYIFRKRHTAKSSIKVCDPSVGLLLCVLKWSSDSNPGTDRQMMYNKYAVHKYINRTITLCIKIGQLTPGTEKLNFLYLML